MSNLLDEYQSKLNFDGVSNILVEQSLRPEVEQWLEKNFGNYAPSTVMLSESTDGKWPHKEDTFTHVITTLAEPSRSTLQHLRYIQWSLKYKGIALLVLHDSFNKDHGSIIDFIENASFERGRIKIIERHSNGGPIQVVIAMKWDLLCA